MNESLAMRIWLPLTVILGGSAAQVAADEAVCAPYVEEQPAWNTASLRPHRTAFQTCRFTEQDYVAVVGGWLVRRAAVGVEKGVEAAGEPSAELKSVGLGRLVDHPWLSLALARAATEDAAWDANRGDAKRGDAERGQARRGDRETAVAAMLSSDRILPRLAAPFAGSGYRVARVSVEKVLVGPAGEVLPDYPNPQALLPFDAQAWLVLEPVGESPPPATGR